MMYRAKAPLRLGLGGGGTDVSPYSDKFGGAVLNATISMYAYATIKPLNNGKVVIRSVDHGKSIAVKAAKTLELDGVFSLVKGVHNRIVRDYAKRPLSYEITTYVDAPAGSGLGTSSTLAVAILGAFAEWQGIPLGEYDLAHLAYEIERKDLGMAGGKQDQYAATFGGFNFIEFYGKDKIIVNPLRIKQECINELEFNTVLYYTGTSRLSSKIIEAQSKTTRKKGSISLDAMHHLKEQASMMKEAILKCKINEIGPLLDYGWKFKKKTAKEVSNPLINEIYDAARKAGASGGKISGAGGGGFMIFYCPLNTKYDVIESLKKFGGEFRRFNFTKYGLRAWEI